MRNLFLVSLLGLLLSCQAQESENYVLKTVNYDELKSVIQKEDGKLYVVNFWATWCKPCIEELPAFMAVNEEYKSDPNFKMILVSMDNKKQLDSKVKNFIEKNNMKVDVYLLDDNKRMNEWIPATDPKWSGAIPATVFYKNGEKVFFKELELTQFELEDLIEENL
jgi:thiol-disulfide isomerase/thioredoxin